MHGHVIYIRFAIHISSIVLPVWWPLQIDCLHLCWHTTHTQTLHTHLTHTHTLHTHTHITHTPYTHLTHTQIPPHTHTDTHTHRDHPVCAVCVRDIGQCHFYFLSPHPGVEHHTAPVRKTVHLGGVHSGLPFMDTSGIYLLWCSYLGIEVFLY